VESVIIDKEIAMKVKLLVPVLLAAVLIIIFAVLYWHDFDLSYEYVAEIPIQVDSDSSKDRYWFTLRNQKYHGFYDEEMLYNLSGLSKVAVDFDYQDYTYVVTYKHQLNRLSISLSRMKDRNAFLLPKQFVGKIYLERKETNSIYIYRVKSIDLDCDYHKISDHVVLIN
jgi:hypothetical protein